MALRRNKKPEVILKILFGSGLQFLLKVMLQGNRRSIFLAFSSSSWFGVAVVDLSSTLGTVVRKKVDCVALATPTDLRRRDGLKEQEHLIKAQTSDAGCRWRNNVNNAWNQNINTAAVPAMTTRWRQSYAPLHRCVSRQIKHIPNTSRHVFGVMKGPSFKL